MSELTHNISNAKPTSLPAVRRRVESFVRSAQESSIEEQQLVEGARQLLRARLKTVKRLPKCLPRESAWDMMLILLINGAEGGILYIKQLILASGEAPATAMRKIDRLEEGNMLERVPDELDHRRVIVKLTERGREAMILMLKDIFSSNVEPDIRPVPYSPISNG
ncbi:hypothetical protein U8326_10825 [Tsuneonella sp. CC-YZS046]|uniref:hypothetical protein n=1 Tax=Tsuneonella sp. CC-YZS046 TaxID=3042152 RepID=UPI002D77E718|nr:hypothetical protein [Tsuneonella sp. CC-YZS046]WRO65544.1 hypothetical protein U8326_10825 [Tsuneonella sp. CC-YZS046]